MSSGVRIFGALLAIGLLFIQPSSVAQAQGAPFCPVGVSPAFGGGFAALKAKLGAVMGDPIECEHSDGPDGDVLQRTTTGLGIWRRASNTPTFTDGSQRWALVSDNVVTWQGSRLDPPNNARGLNPNQNSQGRTPSPAQAGIGAGRRSTPTTYEYRTMDQPLMTNDWPCQTRNPSCGREAWWAEWNDVQDGSPLQYKFIGPGLVTEARFAEAISLLWLWPEGRELLQTAAEHGVAIYNSPEIARRAFAAYRPANQTLLINPNFSEVSTWLLADVIAHELRHASDHATGTRMGGGYGDCVAREQVAFATEARFVRWLADRQGGLPSPDEVSKLLSQEDFALFTDVYRTLNSDNLNAQVEESYRQICSAQR